ncbi:Kynurenine formamidase-like protein [Aphelenchoides besseyi]|nr:Kynurenine formamidase-like protein [Aphelenchoides besseyi]KAI6199541.1 Kynurenine formamidase-like protein [Aphelenchoides besseyi]
MDAVNDYEISYTCSLHPKEPDTRANVLDKWAREQEHCVAELIDEYEHDFDVSYGPQRCDIWYPKNPASVKNVHVFTHGGYWVEFNRRTYCSIVKPHLESGVIVVMVGYTYAKVIPLDQIVEQVKTAILFVADRFPNATITISGHSAGGHLTAKTLECPEIQRLVKSAVLMTPVFEVVPLINTSLGREIKLTEPLARKMNVDWRKVAEFRGDILIVAVKFDAPSLKKQLTDFGRRLSELKDNVRVEHFDEDHFTIATKMHDPNSEISQTIVSFLYNL